MTRMFSAVLILAFLVAAPAVAQVHGNGNSDAHGTAPQARPPSPYYSGMEARRVKALSDEQITDLEAGRGMGLALAAELNLYPGPAHVLELAEPLNLTGEQTSRTKQLLDRMKAETIPIGRHVLAEEIKLDRLFAERKISLANLAETTARIADAQGELRVAHLRYHLEMAEVLSSEQVSQYARLRGYGGGRSLSRSRRSAGEGNCAPAGP
jgi:hypothetical protein